MDFLDLESLAELCGDGDLPVGSCLGPGAVSQRNSLCSQLTQIPQANDTFWWPVQGVSTPQQISHSLSLPSTAASRKRDDAGIRPFRGVHRVMNWSDDDEIAQRVYAWISTLSDQHPHTSLVRASPSSSDDSFSSQFQSSGCPSDVPQTLSMSNDESFLLNIIESLQAMEEQTMEPPVPDIHAENLMFAMEPLNMSSASKPSLHSHTFFETYSRLPTLPFHAELQTWRNRRCTSSDNNWQLAKSSTEPVAQPAITVIRQPPENYRVRYEKEAAQAPKGFLKNDESEPVAIQLEHLPSAVGDVAVTVSVVTRNGILHPTLYASCFGRCMPSDWKEDKVTRTVTTTIKATESHRKSLTFLGLKRNTQDGVDLRGHTRQELNNFCIKFDVFVPSPTGGCQSVTAMTKPVHVLCPSTATKNRRRQREIEITPMSPSKIIRM